MSRKLQWGFETGEFSNGGTEFAGGTTTNVSFDTGTVAPGGSVRSIKFAGQGNVLSPVGGLANSVFQVKFDIFVDGSITARSRVFEIMNNAGTVEFALFIGATGSPSHDRLLSAENSSGTSLGEATTPLEVNKWHKVEMWIPSAAGFTLWLNDIREIAPAASALGLVTRDHISLGPRLTTPGANIWIDNLAMNDNIGSFNLAVAGARIGDESIVMVVPNSDAGTNQWTTQSGGANHFGEINELPGAVDDTKYLKSTSATNNFEDRWGFGDLPSTVPDNANITAVVFGARGGANGTTSGRDWLLRARDAGGNTSDSAAQLWQVNGFQTVWPILTKEAKWDGSNGAIDKAYVDGMQASCVEQNTSTRETRCGTIWASVAYLPPLPVMQPVGGMMTPIGASIA